MNPKPEADGLQLEWHGKRVFCNPPYSDIHPWVEKAVTSRALTVFVIPARCDARWFFLLRDNNAEFRYFRRSFDFHNPVTKKQCHPIGGAMVVIVRRLDR